MFPTFFQNEKSTFQINETQFELIRMNPNQFRETIYNEAEMVIDPITHKVVASMIIDTTDGINCITSLNINLEYENIIDEILQQLLDGAKIKYNALSIKTSTNTFDERIKSFLINHGFELQNEYVVREFKCNNFTHEDEE